MGAVVDKVDKNDSHGGPWGPQGLAPSLHAYRLSPSRVTIQTADVLQKSGLDPNRNKPGGRNMRLDGSGEGLREVRGAAQDVWDLL